MGNLIRYHRSGYQWRRYDMSKKRERLIELDYIRTFAMLAVIVIHVSSAFVYSDSDYPLFGMNVAFILNQVTRFAVPLFVLLSGVALSISHADGSYISFVKKRIVKLAGFYIAWNTVYYLLNSPEISLISFLKSMIYGNSAPHLYFIVIIIQLYLLFPILNKWIKKAPLLTLAGSFFISALLHFFISLPSLGNISILVKLYRVFPFWEAFPTWLFYFVLGMFAVQTGLEKIISFAEKYLYLLFIVSIIFGAWYAHNSFLTDSLDSVKFQLFVYTPLVALTILGMGRKLRGNKTLSAAVSFSACHSQTVYFSHIIILENLRKIPAFSYRMRGMMLLLISEIALSIIFAWIFDWAIKQIFNLAHSKIAVDNSEEI